MGAVQDIDNDTLSKSVKILRKAKIRGFVMIERCCSRQIVNEERIAFMPKTCLVGLSSHSGPVGDIPVLAGQSVEKACSPGIMLSHQKDVIFLE